MNRGPLIFLGVFFALASSWFGLVLQPQAGLGRMVETKTVGDEVIYPVPRSGLAKQGAEIFRANGCEYCHSQEVRQTGTTIDVVLASPGTNQALLISALRQVKHDLDESTARDWSASTPKTILTNVTAADADDITKKLSVGGARAVVQPIPVGADIERGWGARRTVAADYLYDDPVQIGSLRAGPDLANVGLRQADANWHLRHLYAPRSEVKESTMPPYPFLFETRKIVHTASPDALNLPSSYGPPSGYEVTPTYAARALVAYLMSLPANAPLFEAPATLAPAVANTNVPLTITSNSVKVVLPPQATTNTQPR